MTPLQFIPASRGFLSGMAFGMRGVFYMYIGVIHATSFPVPRALFQSREKRPGDEVVIHAVGLFYTPPGENRELNKPTIRMAPTRMILWL